MEVVFGACCPDAILEESRIFMLEGAPSSYDYTGTVAIHPANVDSGAEWPPVAIQSWLPVAGDNVFRWGISVPDTFSVVVTLGEWPFWRPNPVEFVSDYPGFPRPVCYPQDKENRTFWCSGSDVEACGSLNDGYGSDVQLAFDVGMSCPVGTESKTWGALKALYR